MVVCITGSSGFVGKALVARFEKAGHTVIQFDLPDNDILTVRTYPVAPIDLIIHAAAIANLNISAADKMVNFSVNVMGTYLIADWAARIGAKLLYVSTCCAWGRAVQPCMDDLTCPQPTEIYAHSKLAGEYAVKSSPILDYMIFRIGTVYGPGMREALFNYQAIDKVCRRQKIMVYGSGKQRRQYVYIDDLADAFLAAVDRWHNRKTLSVCGREGVSVLDTISTAARIAGQDPIIEYAPGRGEEEFDQEVCIFPAEVYLKWTPKTAFFEGMQKTYAWYKEHKLD